MAYQPDYSIAYGSNYEDTKDLDITEVAKRVKKQLRSEYPGYKWSVRTNRYSGGQSLNVEIREVPDDLQLYNPEWLSEFIETGRYPHRVEKYTEEARELLKAVERLVESYNYDGSDLQTDYFNVRFYKSVEFSRKVEEGRREAAVAAKEEEEATLSKEETLHAMIEVDALKAKLDAAKALVADLDEQIAALEAQLN